MSRDRDEFDPEAPDEREIGREMVDGSTGLGSVVAHLYRGEVDRAVNWRTRLDSTTNWAVTVIAGILAYAFSSEDTAHSIVLVAILIGIVFLLIEARRYRRYDIWRSRVRTMQENLFANALDPTEGIEQRDWRPQLSEDYRDPAVKMPLRDALAHRLRRVYLPLLVGLLLIWLVRLSGEDVSLVRAASVSSTPGWLVIGAVAAVYLSLVAIAVWPDAGAVTETSDEGDRGDLERGE
ncbi:DUF2270 domain-containing protein [Natrinema versiforme]|uniref:DUF2270 domain-containing protein n=1 Tax=Natrinema versiforme TaxID=88724 RepID=A0A4P8WMT0_9EURY|nr:DUF2270 domain-containing protein [Natrinema versiforme]QCS43301.1 DUF2270 domain-containing protein [Natrinema versiforme]